MRKIKERALAGFLALVTAVAPVGTSAMSVYAAEEIPVSESSFVETEAVASESVEVVEENGIQSIATESVSIGIQVIGDGGQVSVKEGTPDEQTVRMAEEEGETKASITDADGNMELLPAEAEKPSLVLEEEAGAMVSVHAAADEGFRIAEYAVSIDAGDTKKDAEGFTPDKFTDFQYNMPAEQDTVITVRFEEIPASEEGETEVQSENGTETETQSENAEQTEAGTEAPSENEAGTEAETEALPEQETGLPEETEGSLIETEGLTEAETEEGTEPQTEEIEVVELEEETEHFLEKEPGAENLNRADFTSKRLVVLTGNSSVIIDPEHLAGNYGDIYLLQYGSDEQAMNAYAYYIKNAEAVSPDKEIVVASEAGDEIALDDNFSSNPVEALSAVPDMPNAAREHAIALIDTGAQAGPNLIGQVSLIDDALSGNGHADAMVSAILSQDPQAGILSIRALDDSGHGTVASIVSALEYAMEQDVEVINLSICARKSLAGAVVTEKIREAVAGGITVVGAAGNEGSDASGFIPGMVDEAWILGACSEDGARLPESNFGATVDYNVVADSTSEAAAKFSGYMTANRFAVSGVNENGLVFSTAYIPQEDLEEETDAEYINGIVKAKTFYIALPLYDDEGFEDSFDPEKDFALEFAPDVEKDAYSVEVAELDEGFDKHQKGSYPVTYQVSAKDGETEPVVVESRLVVTDYTTKQGMERLAEEFGIADLLTEEGLDPGYLASSKYPGSVRLYFGEGGSLPDDYYDTSKPYFDNIMGLFCMRGESLYPDGEYASDVIDYEDEAEADFETAYNCGYTRAAKYGSGSGIVQTNGSSSWNVRFTSGPLAGKTITMNCHAHTAAPLYAGQGGTYKYYQDGYVHFVTPDTCTGASNGFGLTGYQCAAGKTSPPAIMLNLTKTANVEGRRLLTVQIDSKTNFPSSVRNTVKKSYNLAATFAVYASYADAENDVNRLWTMKTGASDGKASKTLDNKKAGTYYIKEVEAPKNMLLSRNIKEFTLKAGKTTSLSFGNDEVFVPIEIFKTDGAGNVVPGLAGTQFTVYTNPACTKRVKYYEDGKWKPTPVIEIGQDGRGVSGAIYPVGATVYIKETKVMPGFTDTGKAYPVALTSTTVNDSAGNVVEYQAVTATLTVINTNGPTPAQFYIRKVCNPETQGLTLLNGRINPMYADLSGATYAMQYANGTPVKDNSGNDIIFVTNADGISNSYPFSTDPTCPGAIYIAPGTYYFEETKAPKNYQRTKSTVGDYKWSLTIGSEGLPAYFEVKDDPVNDPQMVKLQKQDPKTGTAIAPAGDQDLSGAEFKLSYWAVETDKNSREIPSGTPDLTWTFRTIRNGVLDLGDSECLVSGQFVSLDEKGDGAFPVGTYVLEETKAPYGFVTPGAGEVVLIGHNNHYPEIDETRSFFNWVDFTNTGIIKEEPSQNYIRLYERGAVYHDVAVQKYDLEQGSASIQGDSSLEGITFGIFNRSKNSVYVNGTEYKPDTEITALRMVTDKNGRASTEGIVAGGALPVGTYGIRELASNASYVLTDGAEHRFQLTETELVKEDGTKVPYTGATTVHAVTVKDKVVRGGVEVQKYDKMLDRNAPHGDAGLSGAEFSIVNASAAAILDKNLSEKGTATLSDASSYDEILAAAGAGALVQVITTNANGYAATGSTDLAYGTYYIIETKAPTGYDINREWIGKVAIRTNGKIYSLSEGNGSTVLNNPYNDAAVREQIWTSGLELKKMDYMRDTDMPHGDADLSGAEFTIINASASLVKNKDGKEIPTCGISGNANYTQLLAAAKKSTVQVVKTDHTGTASTGLSDLPYGTYYVIETKAPDGYFVNTTWVAKIEVRENGTAYEPQVIAKGNHDETQHAENEAHDVSGDALTGAEGHDHAVCDQIYRSGISIDKIDKEMKKNIRQGEAVLSGAKFTIINASKTSIRNKDGKDVPAAEVSETPTYEELRQIADAGDFTVQVLVTDVNGHTRTGRHDLPYGTYYVIETKSSYGYFIDDSFVGKIVVRSDNELLTLGQESGGSSFVDVNDTASELLATVDQQVRRSDLSFLKVNIDGEYKAYIPFLVSAIRLNPDGSETILESHVIVSNAYGQVDTSRKHSVNTNGMDQYVKGSTITAEGEAHLKEAAGWGVWFQGNTDTYPKNAINDSFGALYNGYYRITELHCEDNKGLGENLLNSGLIHVENDIVDLTETMTSNNKMIVYHPLVDTEIVLTSKALDVESGTKTLPAREQVEAYDTVTYTHVSADHKYRLETQFRDLTEGGRVLKLTGTNDPDASLSADGIWVRKEFYPEKKSGTNNTYGEISISALLNTKGLNGHTIMAVDYLYEYIDITGNDAVKGDWVLVKVHPQEGTVDENQYLYVPDLHTNAADVLTGDREGAKSEEDAIMDQVAYSNLSGYEQYIIAMTLKDTKTGEPVSTDGNGNAKVVYSKVLFSRKDAPVSGTVILPEYALDSSAFTGNKSVTVVESLYRTDEDGSPLGEPILVHDSLLDEDQTIRWPDICTAAIDRDTKDDVGKSGSDSVVYDTVQISNVIFDDNDHEGAYTYTVKGKLVYQKDFIDADGVSHKAGESVEILDGTKDVVTITSDAAGNASFTYEDGTTAKGTVTIRRHGKNVAKSLDGTVTADNSYVDDNTCSIADVEVEMVYHVNSAKLEGGSVVAFETLYHDAEAEGKAEIAAHRDIRDKKQTIHYPKVRTSAIHDETKDDVGAVKKDASITDTVILTNLVPGRDYLVSGRLMDQDTGEEFLVNGKPVTQSASIHVTDDGQIVSGNGEKVTVTSYDQETNEVCGTVDLVFTFDASAQEGKTVVVFEDLFHKGVKVAVHEDIKDRSQTIHFPKIRTTAADWYTKDHVGTITGEAVLVDTVKYENLVPGREYTVKGTLMVKGTQKPLLSADGRKIMAERTFTAGKTGDGLVVSNLDEDKNRVSGSVDITFTFDASLLEDKTLVAFEKLEHNGIEVEAHEDLEDEEQAVHFPKVRTSAIDKNVGDEVGEVAETILTDTVNLWNLVPGMEYRVSGVVMDKETGEPILIGGKKVTKEAVFTVQENGTLVPGNGEKTSISKFDRKNNRVDASIDLDFELDASGLEGKTLVVFETLYHNQVDVARHTEIGDLAQTIHFPKIRTNAVDTATGDHAGTVAGEMKIEDAVSYENLVIGKEYTIKGTLMDQDTGLPIVNPDGKLVEAKATFVVDIDGNDKNTVLTYDLENRVASGIYKLVFTVDSRQLAGKTAVVFEDLYHNGRKVATHSDLYDKEQSVHFPQIRTTASDRDTGDHVGSIWGALVNGVRHFFGETDADGNGIPDDKQENIIDTVELTNLVPGYSYVVSGKLYDAGESSKAGSAVPLLIDGKETTWAVTITVSEDGRFISSSDGAYREVTSYDEKKNSVCGTVDLTYILDSSKIQGKEVVVFETLYHDKSYSQATNPNTVEEKDIIHKHADWTDKGQSISEVSIHTTAVDTKTGGHVGSTPDRDSFSVIHDEVNLAKLVPGMEYTIEGALVELSQDGLDKVRYLKADGTLTKNREEALTQSVTFTAGSTEETHYLNFSIASDKVQGKAFTVFEDLYHGGVKISTHPAYDQDGWDEQGIASQTVYYPSGKTNATDNTTGVHTSYADGVRKVTDRVYFKNLLVGQKYEVTGRLVFQSDFVDSEGVFHKAGSPVPSDGVSVAFTAAEGLTSVPYTVSPDGVEYAGGDGAPVAAVDSLTVASYPDGQKSISGYVSLEFIVNAASLEGATIVAFESFSNNGAGVFTHADLNDLPQTVKIPKIRTTAQTEGLDEAAVYDENGKLVRIDIVDKVSYENLWTQKELDEMAAQGKKIFYLDGSAMEHTGDIYQIREDASYLLKGTLMDKTTGKPLVNNNGETYVSYSEVFRPESPDGYGNVEFTIDAADFAEEDGSCSLEGKTLVVFEELYQAGDKESADKSTIIASHEDLSDTDQDIRLPKGRTHALDGIPEDILKGLTEKQIEALQDGHTVELVTTGHESYAGDVTITDYVAFENLHGGTKYTVTGTLMLVTEEDENGHALAWEPAKDDNGKPVTVTETLDTSVFDTEYDSHVSGYLPLTFTFKGTSLAGKRTVVFESFMREGKKILIHADADDEGQTIFFPKIYTNAVDAATGLHTMLYGKQAFIIDQVRYENLQAGKIYKLEGVLMDQETGEAIGASMEGEFVAGVDSQYITGDGTRAMTAEECLAYTKGEELPGMDVLSRVDEKGSQMERTDGYVNLVIPVDASALEGHTLTAFEFLSAKDEEGKDKPLASHEDINDLAQTVKIPLIRTTAQAGGLDEAAAFAADGSSRTVTITDTVRYENLWTKESLEALRKAAGSYFDVPDEASYVMKGTLMDKETGKALVNANGETYTVYSDAFSPEAEDGSLELAFVLDTKDFVKDGENLLEGKAVVVFEELFAVGTKEEAGEGKHKIGSHEDLTDTSQDIRFPKGRTHVADGENAQDVSGHGQEKASITHEAFAGGDMVLTDVVSFENLHGGTKYTVTGTLQVVTGYGEDGKPNAWEEAKDDNGNAITASGILDTSSFSTDYDANVSGTFPITFRFSGVSLAGKTTVVFEEFTREGISVLVHADITDKAQTIYIPKIGTSASDARTGLKETIAGADTVILDKVSYENLSYGEVYSLSGQLYRKSDGSAIEGACTKGTFIAGVSGQYIFPDGTKVLTEEELERVLAGEILSGTVQEAPVPGGERVSGDVYVVIPVDTTELEGDTMVAFETLSAVSEENGEKKIASHEDLEDEEQSVQVPKIRTQAAIGNKKKATEGTFKKITDTVSYENLTPGRTYTMKGVLMDKADGESTGITAETTFTPDQPDGTVEVEFVTDGKGFGGHTLVVFEELITENDAKEEVTVAVHQDIEDEDQSVVVEKPQKKTPSIQTGDMPFLPVLVLAVLMAAVIVAAGIYRRRKK